MMDFNASSSLSGRLSALIKLLRLQLLGASVHFRIDHRRLVLHLRKLYVDQGSYAFVFFLCVRPKEFHLVLIGGIIRRRCLGFLTLRLLAIGWSKRIGCDG